MAVDIAIAAEPAASVSKLASGSVEVGHRFADALRRTSIAVIAEIKRKSPSRGPIRPELDAGELARQYLAGGATCLSVLTDRELFGGSPEDLRAAKHAAGLPVLRKDFLRSLDDVWESHEMGADAMLVILADIDQSEFRPMQELALSLGVDVLTEVRDEAELKAAVDLGAYLIAVNQRNLPQSTEFTVDHNKAVRVSRCFDAIDNEILLVAASGIGVPGGTSMAAIAEVGYDAALIGEALVTADDAPALLRELLAEVTRD